ncbi:hypothetical protein BC826DRAFT_1013370 [Russula brevipes]|nr:hypothetical protein BC826DRAFT_1013370 [Russula brevipes]
MSCSPRTPSSSSPYRPHTSSPLSESFPLSPSRPPAAKLQSPRLAQYKSTSTPTRRVSSAFHSRPPRHAAADEPNFSASLFSSSVAAPGDAENPRSALLRYRLRQRCASRAQEARTKRVERERRRNGLSSDGEDMSMESDEEDDDDVLNDELFRRIIASVRHKQRHSYRLSFQNEVGSSLDPDMEDIAELERALQEGGPLPIDVPDVPPSDFDEEEIAELAAQAEEAELWADIDVAHSILNLDDIDISPKLRAIPDEDVDMA